VDSTHGCALARSARALRSWRTVASRLYRWQKSGVWERVLWALQARSDAEGHLDWDAHLVDATVVRAHQQAAGAKKRLPMSRLR
jgi:hypothetical protein